MSGFLAGLLGVGGGIVVVPVLYHVLAAFDVDVALRAHIAVGTSLATIIPTSVQSIRADTSIRGRITIGAEHKTGPERVEFFVRDNGPGVPAKRRKNLFEPLRTTKSDGLGLGLPICLTIVEAHGGQIWLENGQAGATEFRFWLPLK